MTSWTDIVSCNSTVADLECGVKNRRDWLEFDHDWEAIMLQNECQQNEVNVDHVQVSAEGKKWEFSPVLVHGYRHTPGLPWLNYTEVDKEGGSEIEHQCKQKQYRNILTFKCASALPVDYAVGGYHCATTDKIHFALQSFGFNHAAYFPSMFCMV